MQQGQEGATIQNRMTRIAVIAVALTVTLVQPAGALTREQVIDRSIEAGMGFSFDLSETTGTHIGSDITDCRTTSRTSGSCALRAQPVDRTPPICRATVAVRQNGQNVWAELRDVRCGPLPLDW